MPKQMALAPHGRVLVFDVVSGLCARAMHGPGSPQPTAMAAAELTDADLCLALPSDTELALQILWKDCPPGALV